MKVAGLVAESTVRTVLLLFSGRLIKVLGVFLGTGICTNAVGGLVWMLLRVTSIPGVLVTYHSLAVVLSSSQHVDPVAVDSVSTKSCYVLLLSLTPCTPIVSKFSPIYGPIDWKSTWASLYFLPSDRHVSDVNREIAHGVLYIADRLISFGLDVPAACFCGAALETPAHLFFRCPLARSGVDWVQNLLSTFSVDAPSLDVRHLLYGFSEADLRTVPKVFCYILNECKFFISSQRNDFCFRSVRPSAVGLICSIKARLHFFLPVFFRLFRSARGRRVFHKQWGANGVIAW